ncbi:MAG: NAD(P)-binding protein [Planctomycetes bacterium]|nr:NAD(P)-binding protein [Planctomycetota bacterium]
MRDAVIVGGGLAGVAAAIRLAQAGWRPTVIETRKRPGGRATSFVDPRTGALLDNCQHVLLGCCTNLLDLYQRLGVLDSIEWHRTLFWTAGHGEIDEVAAGWLPAPLHLARAFGRMRTFDATERRWIRRGMWRIMRLGEGGCHRWRGRTFAEFLRESGQGDGVIRRFWNTVIVSACNLDVERVDAAVALYVFRTGFLANRWSYTMGLSSVPLVDLYEPALAAIEDAGGSVRLGTSARAISFDGSRATGVVTTGGLVEASCVVAAVPPDRLGKLVSDAVRARDRRLADLDGIDVSPILAVHLRFERTVMDRPHLVLVDRDVHWLFDKGVDADGRQHVHAVVSGADAWMDLDEDEIVRRVVADVWHAVPAAKGLEPVDARAVKEKRATFACTPEVEALRPRSAPGYVGVGGGDVPNLYLAGDWCDTGWPATMEGAVRSGYAAAGAIIGEDLIVEDVPAGMLARALGL